MCVPSLFCKWCHSPSRVPDLALCSWPGQDHRYPCPATPGPTFLLSTETVSLGGLCSLTPEASSPSPSLLKHCTSVPLAVSTRQAFSWLGPSRVVLRCLRHNFILVPSSRAHRGDKSPLFVIALSRVFSSLGAGSYFIACNMILCFWSW